MLCVIWLDRKHCRWTCATTTLHIDIYLHGEYRKTSFICCLIVTTENLIWPVVFFIFLFMVTGRGIFFCRADLTFAVNSMKSNLALISDRHNIKPAPKERISLWISHVTVVLRHRFFSFLIIWVIVFTFRGCTSSQLANTIS